jgi:hypothetical protein
MLDRLRRLIGLAPAAPAPATPDLPAAACPPVEPAYGSWTPDRRWIARRRATPMTYALSDLLGVAALKAAMPDHAAALVAAADRAVRHEFNLLGSGPFVPLDPDRAAVDGYQPIDWYLDPVRGLRFPRGVHHKAWKLYEMRPGNADVKYPWELARCQHWVTLGQAYRLTGDERYAREIANQLGDFVAANPVGVGINWTCTMDVGLRTVSWVIALDLVRDSALDEEFWVRAAEALFDHGLFIKGNLENTYEVTSNHFLSNVVGLWFLAGMFDDLDAGAEWEAFARTSLEQEIDVQVLPDGADFESSVPYHRLVAELFMGSSRLGDFRGWPLSDHYRSRVRDMAAYLADVTRPDGLMPQSGDADDGRLHVFGGLGTATPQDGRHLLGPAAAMCERPEWAVIAGADGSWEAAWWGQPLAPAPHKGVPYEAGGVMCRDVRHNAVTPSRLPRSAAHRHPLDGQRSLRPRQQRRLLLVLRHGGERLPDRGQRHRHPRPSGHRHRRRIELPVPRRGELSRHDSRRHRPRAARDVERRVCDCAVPWHRGRAVRRGAVRARLRGPGDAPAGADPGGDQERGRRPQKGLKSQPIPWRTR